MMHTRYPVGRARFGRVPTSWLGSGLLAASVLVGGAGCDDKADSGPTGFEIKVAPLTLPGITDACYSINVYNSTTTFDATTAVWSKTNVCASDYGDGSGSITYVGTCDASETENTVELTLEGLWTNGASDAGGSVALTNGTDFINPCTGASPERTCRLVRPCNPNADTLVEFNLTIMRNAEQGFFDIAVNFEDIFCSAKADCEEPNGDSLDLLFNGTERDSTAVLAFACTGGENADTHLYLSDTFIVCDGTTNTTNATTPPGTHVVARLKPNGGPGNVASPIPDQGLFGYGVYEGRHLGTTNSAYWNLAVGFDDTFFYGCPAGYMHQGGECVTCQSDANLLAGGLGRNAIKGMCGYCPAGSTYLNGTCLGCADPNQKFYPDLNKCGGDYFSGLAWTDAVEFPPVNCQDGSAYTGGASCTDFTTFQPTPIVAATTAIKVPLSASNPRSCHAYAWASAADELWPELSTPDDTTYPTVRYRVPLNPPAVANGPASSSLSCGANPLNDGNGVVETQYTTMSQPACFENVLTTDWGSATNTVDTSRFAQFSNFRSHQLVTPLPDQVPPCEYNWDTFFAKGGSPVNHESPSQQVRVFSFDDLDLDGEQDAGEPLVGGFTFAVVTQTLMAPTAMLEGASPYIRTAQSTASGPANFPNTHAGNYLVSVVGRPGTGLPCAAFNGYTSPQVLTWGTSPPAPWNPQGGFSTLFTVGGPSQFDGDLYVGLDCQ